MDTFNARIERCRIRRHLWESELARKAHIRADMIRHYEAGVKIPSPEHLRKLAGVLDMDISCLVPPVSDAPSSVAGAVYNLMDAYGSVTLSKGTDGRVAITLDGDMAQEVLRDLLQRTGKDMFTFNPGSDTEIALLAYPGMDGGISSR